MSRALFGMVCRQPEGLVGAPIQLRRVVAPEERVNVSGRGGPKKQRGNSHHRPADVINGDDALLLAVHGLREEREGLLDLGLLLRRDVVLLGELGLPRASLARCA